MLFRSLGASVKLPASGTVFISVKAQDKARIVPVARDLEAMGYKLIATRGTAAALTEAGIKVLVVNKVTEGRPNIADMIKNGEVQLVLNTVEERRNAIADSKVIRTTALAARVVTYTTLFGAEAAVEGMKNLDKLTVYSLQELHARLLAEQNTKG